MINTKAKKNLYVGLAFITAFILWTVMIITTDVQPMGVNGTDIGLSTINLWFHRLTGANMTLYIITDWLGLVPIFSCLVFGFVGAVQFVKRKSLAKVDRDIIILSVYYISVIFLYLFFETIPINYRPILINGYMEASYPSSTTLLVLSVMPTVSFQTKRMVKNSTACKVLNILAIAFSAFMVIGRLLSGVHWLSDIIASVLVSAGLFCIYKSLVLMYDKEK